VQQWKRFYSLQSIRKESQRRRKKQNENGKNMNPYTTPDSRSRSRAPYTKRLATVISSIAGNDELVRLFGTLKPVLKRKPLEHAVKTEIRAHGKKRR
jgi:hypothetical protein